MRALEVEQSTVAISLAVVVASAACLVLHGVLLESGAFDGLRLVPAASLATVAVWMLVWTLMFVAMMGPSSAPFLIAVRRAGGDVLAAAAGFSAVWLAVGLAILMVIIAFGEGLSRLAPGSAERLAGGALLLAALYSASPLALACQRACANPRAVLARRWRAAETRLRDTTRAGIDYGLRCVGCCIPMLAVMLIVGMHDARWTIALALQMTLLKMRSTGQAAALVGTVGCAAAGIAILAGQWSPSLRSLRELCGL